MKEVMGFNPETQKPIYGEILPSAKQEKFAYLPKEIYFIVINKSGDMYPLYMIYPPEEIAWPDDPLECAGMALGFALADGIRLAGKGVTALIRYQKERQQRRASIAQHKGSYVFLSGV